MTAYLLAYHGGGMPQTDADRERTTAAWNAWYQDLGPAIADGGNPVGLAMTVNADGSTRQGGGNNPVSGYTIINASNMTDAVTMSKTCPVLTGGGSVEVCETFAVM